jgi:hypothetical protein
MVKMGADGVGGCVLIITSSELPEVHPDALVTVNAYVPAVSPEIVVVEPVPATAPGLITQLPVGKPLNNTLPVAEKHVVCVIVPMPGADGVKG